MKKILALCILWMALGIMGLRAQKTIVWDTPGTTYGTHYGDGFFEPAVDVARVELKDEETIVYLTVRLNSALPESTFRFASDIYLLADGGKYPAVSADGMELGKPFRTGVDGRLDVAIRFKPLPRRTRVFDIIGKDAATDFRVTGIRPAEECGKVLFPSYWRNERTGNWDIALLEDCAVYDCKFWTYKNRPDQAGNTASAATLVLTDGREELTVALGPCRKGGRRSIRIGNRKDLYSVIAGRFLPDYPSEDARTDFVDTGYTPDTATIVGWIKDMPLRYRDNKVFSIAMEDLLFDTEVEHNAEMDSLGRFTIRIPLLNSTECFCDWERCALRTLLEPGKTYFLLYDFKEGRRMFMGDDVRLQNEFCRFPIDWQWVRMERGGDFDRYLVSADSLVRSRHASIDSLCRSHPGLSARFGRYQKGNTVWQQAYALVQARFDTPGFRLPDNARRYVRDHFWTKIEQPYTLHREFSSFLHDYIDDCVADAALSAARLPATFNIMDHLEEIAADREELDFLLEWKAWVEQYNAKIASATDTAEVQRLADEANTKNAGKIGNVQRILNTPRAQRVMQTYLLPARIRLEMQMLDSLGADNFIKKLRISKLVTDEIEQNRRPLSPQLMDTVRALVDYPVMLDGIERQNNRYVALESRKLDQLVLNMGENMAGMTEGKEILADILAPYKGKIVLLDIWGTWCGPCKQALSHSGEQFARFADYDIQYVYLANRSPKDSWENVIKEYNVTGPNVAHFNLPEEQQSAVERYLQVHSFPTYKIFDRQGNLLDLNVDTRDPDGLEEIFRALSE